MSKKNPGVRYNEAINDINAMPSPGPDIAYRYFSGAILTQMQEPGNRGKLSAKRVADAMADAYVHADSCEVSKNRAADALNA